MHQAGVSSSASPPHLPTTHSSDVLQLSPVGQCRWCFQITAEAAAHTFSASPAVDQFKVYVSLEEKKIMLLNDNGSNNFYYRCFNYKVILLIRSQVCKSEKLVICILEKVQRDCVRNMLELTSTGCALLNAMISARERTGEYDKLDK